MTTVREMPGVGEREDKKVGVSDKTER